MNEKQLSERAGNLEAIARKWGILDANKPLKMTTYEICDAIDKLLASNYRRLEKAKRVYREQVREIERISSPSLWKFDKFTTAPPEYKAQYMEMLRKRGEKITS